MAELGKKPRGQMSESMLTAVFIILSGGLQDAYTYLCRGKVFANALVSFVCAMQVQTFRKVRGHAYASTMCIGNMRSGTEALCVYLHRKRGLFSQVVLGAPLRALRVEALGIARG